ncbi:MAG: nuclear transport factor 2 family protein [Chloroflexi bacterium]|nr:nuclear transport factor 2 family protein [Chloroflexota bacterium]
MSEPSGREVVERFVRAIVEKDFDAAESILADDIIDEMPQSGERIRGKANWLAIARNYPGGVGTVEPGSIKVVGADDKWVLTPSFSVLRIEGSGNVFTYAGTMRYADGQTWQSVAIVEVRDGKVARTTTWYAAPFEAPAWRAPFVERFTP